MTGVQAYLLPGTHMLGVACEGVHEAPISWLPHTDATVCHIDGQIRKNAVQTSGQRALSMKNAVMPT